MERVDVNNDGYLSYEDLLLSYVSMTLSEKEERMWAAFSKLDVDNSGRVDLDDLSQVRNNHMKTLHLTAYTTSNRP